jgi:tetratricopeptide (TPR) repeat protein
MTTAMKMNKKRLIIILAIVLVLVGGGVAYGIWRIQESYRAVEESSKKPKKEIPQYKTDQKQALIDEVNQKYGKGDYKGAIQLIEGQQNVGDVNIQLLLAGAYANSGDLKKALEIYKKLDDADRLPDTSVENVAATAERAGDYRLAIDMYKRAKEFAASSTDQNSDQTAVYDYKIAELEKKL